MDELTSNPEINIELERLKRRLSRKPRHTIAKIEKMLLYENRQTKKLDFAYTIKFYIYAFLLLNWSYVNTKRTPLRNYVKLIEKLIPENIRNDIRKQFAYNKVFKRHTTLTPNFKQVNPYE